MAGYRVNDYFEHPIIRRVNGNAVERLIVRGHTCAGMIAWECRETFHIGWIVECRLRHYGWIGTELNKHGEYPLIETVRGF
jgi:hypothetical protein